MLLELLSVGQSGIISYRGRKLHFHAPIGALVFSQAAIGPWLQYGPIAV